MTDFGSDQVFSPNFQIAIYQEPLGVRSSNFQSSHISMISTNGAKMKKFREIRPSSSKKIGRFDTELPLVDLDWDSLNFSNAPNTEKEI